MNALNQTSTTSRRTFIMRSFQIAAGLVMTSPLNSLAVPVRYHVLPLYHTHTRETLVVTVDLTNRRLDNYDAAYRFLRDFRTGETHTIDFQLFEILSRIQLKLKSSGTFEVISGYRSPLTNEQLRKTGNGVAKKSLHVFGKAIDIRLTDTATKVLRKEAWDMQRGGVGYYPKSDFIHLDTGRVRSW